MSVEARPEAVKDFSLRDSARNIKFTITLGGSKKHLVWSDWDTLTFGEFAKKLLSPTVGPKDGPCFVPGTFKDTKRTLTDADELGVLIIDSDCGHTLADLVEKLKAAGLAGVIASTHSHLTTKTGISIKAYDRWLAAEGRSFDDPDAPRDFLRAKKGFLSRISEHATIEGKSADGADYIFKHDPIPKFRLAIPMPRPWIASEHPRGVEDWRERYTGALALLGIYGDRSCTDASRLFYWSRTRPGGPEFEWAVVDGEALDILTIEPEAIEEEKPAKERATVSERGRRREAGAPDLAPRVAREPIDSPDRYRIGDFDLVQWAASYAGRFEARNALRARAGGVFGVRGAYGVKHHFRCAFDDEHTRANDLTGTYIVNASELHRAGLPSITSGFFIDCSHDACQGRDRLDHLKRMIELGWLWVDDLTNPKFLAARAMGTPGFPAPTLTLAKARVEAMARGEKVADYLAEYREARRIEKNNASVGIFVGFTAAQSFYFDWSTGVGKTEAMLCAVLSQAVGAAARDESVIFAVPMHALSAEVKRRIEDKAKELGLDVMVAVYRGREQIDLEAPPPGPGEIPTRMCARPDESDEVLKALTRKEKVCKSDGGTCPAYAICGTQRLLRTKADIWIIPHALLTMERPKMIGAPRVVVIDENCRGALVKGCDDVERRAALHEIGRRRVVRNEDEGESARRTAQLHATMRVINSVLRDFKPGEAIPVEAFRAAGLDEKSLGEAIKYLYGTAEPVPIRADMPDAEITRLARAAQKKNGALPSVIQAVKLIKHAMRVGDDRLYGSWIEGDLPGPMGSTYDALRMRWQEPIDSAWDAPIAYLDATGRIENVAALIPRVGSVSTIRVKIEHAHFRQILWSGAKHLWSNKKADAEAGGDVEGEEAGPNEREWQRLKRAVLMGTATDLDKARLAAMEAKHKANVAARDNNVERLVRHIRAREFRHRGEGGFVTLPDGQRHQIDGLVICQADLEDKIIPHLSPNVATLHFGNLVGVDEFKEIAWCVVIGRTLPAPGDIEILAEVVHKRDIEKLPKVEGKDAPYPRRPSAIRIRGQEQGPLIDVPYHPDLYAEALRQEIAEGGVLQAIGRTRAAGRTAANPVHIDIFSDMVLQIEIDEVVEWDVAQKENDIMTLASNGFILAGGRAKAEYASRLAPEIWADAQAHWDWSRRGGEGASKVVEYDSVCNPLRVTLAKSKEKESPIGKCQSDARLVETFPSSATVERRKPRDVYEHFAFFVVRIAEGPGSRYDQIIGVDLAQHRDPKAVLEAALKGKLKRIEYIRLPGADAYNAAPGDTSEEAHFERVMRGAAGISLAAADEIPEARNAVPVAPLQPGTVLAPFGRDSDFVAFPYITSADRGELWLYRPADGTWWADVSEDAVAFDPSRFRPAEPPAVVLDAAERYRRDRPAGA